MGTLESGVCLAEAVRHAAISATLHDPRFGPVGPEELKDLTIEVSVLSAPEPMRDLNGLEIGRHGIIVSRGHHRGLFLPQVATEHGLDRETFLSRCCSEKAGLPPTAWRDPDTEVLLFTAEVFSENPTETSS
jgi:AmmeMemoRadiSam system protein A